MQQYQYKKGDKQVNRQFYYIYRDLEKAEIFYYKGDIKGKTEQATAIQTEYSQFCVKRILWFACDEDYCGLKICVLNI